VEKKMESLGGWEVHKFGGTSLANADAYRSASRIILENHKIGSKTAIVVSAQGTLKNPDGTQKSDKVTNMLYSATTLAGQRNPMYKSVLAQLQDRHYFVAEDLLGSGTLELLKYKKDIDGDFGDLEHILQTVWLSKGLVDMDWWTGYGEIWSAKLMAAHLRQILCSGSNPGSPKSNANSGGDEKASMRLESIQSLDARTVLTVKNHPMGVLPEIEKSRERMVQWFQMHPDTEMLVITGYIGTLDTGSPCTLGRDGSDYSASIFGVVLNAASVTIWTDVDGVYSANPAAVKRAVIRPELSYSEAMELAYFGAKVIHPKTMTPVVVHKIPVFIRNTFASKNPGSKICAPENKKPSKVVIQGFSCINNLCLVNVEGSGMIGVPGVARRLFQAVQEASCSVVLITQAGSEHSICVAVPMQQADRVVDAITRQFRDELEYKEVRILSLIDYAEI
jgi:aspartokinase/homoserine dehydrogenase 1